MNKIMITIVIILTILLGGNIQFSIENKKNVEISDEINEKYDAKDLLVLEESFDSLFNKLKKEADIVNIKEIISDYIINNKTIISNVYFCDIEGKFFIEPIIELAENYDFRQRLPFKEALSAGFYKPELYREYNSDSYIQTICKAVYINKELVGVLGIDFNVSSEN